MRMLLALITALAALAVACSTTDSSGGDDAGKVVLMTHDSFAVSGGTLEKFTDETGIEVEVLMAGDAGEVVNKAVLTKDNPDADVLYGVDNSFLSRALDAGIFVPYRATNIDEIPAELRVDDQNRVAPIDYGDVCVNWDKSFFTEKGLAAPTTLQELAQPEYQDLLVVENPATSSPGLSFLLATVAEFGTDSDSGWQAYWESLDTANVAVTTGWEEAYNQEFTAGAGAGSKPLVVSYATSPVAEVVFADPPVTEARTGSFTTGCFRQIEFAGVLDGASNEAGARQLVDFMLSTTFQEDIPLNMFVFPANSKAQLPAEFSEYAASVDSPVELPYEEIGANREEWIEQWTEIVHG